MAAAAGRELRIALVGATGVVGGQLADLIAERNFPRSELKLFASETGAAETVAVGDEDQPVSELGGPADLAGFDVAFLAVSPGVAADIIRAHPGPILIDVSAAARPVSGVLLAAPGMVSRERIAAVAPGEVVAIPHPSAYALEPS